MFDASRPAELQQALAALCALEGLGRFVLYVSQVSSLAMPLAIPVAKQLPSNIKWNVHVCRHPMQAGGNDAVRAVVSNAARRLQQRARTFERWMYKPVRRHQQVMAACMHYFRQMLRVAHGCQREMPNSSVAFHARSHRHRGASITGMVSTGPFESGATRTSLCWMTTCKSRPTSCCISRCADHARDICHFAIILTEALLELSGAACRLWHRCWRWTPPCGVYLPGTTTAGQLASAGTPSAW